MWHATESGNILKNYAMKTSYDSFFNRKTAAALCSDLLSSFEECHIVSMLFREGLGDCLRGAPYATAYDLSLAKGRVRVFAKKLGLNDETVENTVSLIGTFVDASTGNGQVSLSEVLQMQRERAREYEAQRDQRVEIKQETDFDRLICANVENLSISSTYVDKKLPSLRPFTNLKKFSSFFPVTWDKVAEIDMQSVQDLYFVNSDISSDIKISAPMLERLSIYNNSNSYEELTPIEKMMRCTGPRLNIQAPKLKHLELNHFSGYDLSAVASVESLEVLLLKHFEVADLSWLTGCKKLKKLYIVDSTISDIRDIPALDSLQELYLDYSGIESLRSIAIFPNLRILNLRGNRISTISEPERLNHIRQIDVTKNPVAENGKLNGLDVPHLILTDSDRDRYKFEGEMKTVFWKAYYTYLQRDKSIDNLHPVLKQRWMSRSEEEWFSSYANFQFEESFYSLNPTAIGVEYDTKLKRQFLEFVKEQYPFITIKDDYEKQIQREYFGISHYHKEEPGNVIYVNQSLFVIRIMLVDGEKGVDVEYFNTGGQRHQNLRNSTIKKMITEECPYIDLSHTKVRIAVFDLYRTGNVSGIETGILAALHTLKQKISLPATTFIAGEYKQKGLFKRLKVSPRSLRLAKDHKADRIMLFTSGKQGQTRDDGISVEYCNDLNVLRQTPAEE